jgi:hypothetical protein
MQVDVFMAEWLLKKFIIIFFYEFGWMWLIANEVGLMAWGKKVIKIQFSHILDGKALERKHMKILSRASGIFCNI